METPWNPTPSTEEFSGCVYNNNNTLNNDNNNKRNHNDDENLDDNDYNIKWVAGRRWSPK